MDLKKASFGEVGNFMCLNTYNFLILAGKLYLLILIFTVKMKSMLYLGYSLKSCSKLYIFLFSAENGHGFIGLLLQRNAIIASEKLQ